jgi:hypothetical protein
VTTCCSYLAVFFAARWARAASIMASAYVGLACLPLAASHRALYVVRHCSTHDEAFLPGVRDWGRDPVLEDPVLEDPVLEAPVLEEPVLEEPVLEAPVLEEPVVLVPTGLPDDDRMGVRGSTRRE